MTDFISQSIVKMGIDVYRQDFNMFPLYYWRANERKDRQGIREMKYIAGLYQFWDDLLAAHPELLIDNCASGGRRIDIETLRRSIVLTRSDVIYRNPISSQCIGYGLSHWIPFHGMGAVTVEPYTVRSGLGAVCVIAVNLNAGEQVWNQLNHYIEQYQEYRKFYEGDFYPLTPYELDADQTLAWQYDRPDLHAGLIQAFRRNDCPAESIELKLQGLDVNRTYTVTDVDHPESPRTLSGAELSAGIRFDFPAKPAAVLWVYRANPEMEKAAQATPVSLSK
jgi:alpha-galactosidase